jgi:hypothetical protein
MRLRSIVLLGIKGMNDSEIHTVGILERLSSVTRLTILASLVHVAVLVHSSPKRQYTSNETHQTLIVLSLLDSTKCERSNLNRAGVIKWPVLRNPSKVARRKKHKTNTKELITMCHRAQRVQVLLREKVSKSERRPRNLRAPCAVA